MARPGVLTLIVLLNLICLSSSALSEKQSSQSAGNHQEKNITYTLRGRVTDSITGEPLTGASIYISEIQTGTTTGFDGSYIIKNLSAGKFTLAVSYTGYEQKQQIREIGGDTPEVTCHLALSRKITQLDLITVRGRLEGNSEVTARVLEKEAVIVMNIMSASAIELSPDLNIAQVIQRISGVTLEKNGAGDAQYAILRGMDKRYNYTLVNGVKITCPDNRHRYIPINLFSSELVDRVEVTKSLTADMEGDASGGAVNMVMKDAPTGFRAAINISQGYNSYFLGNKYIYTPGTQYLPEPPRWLNGADFKATMADFGSEWGKLKSKKPIPDGVYGVSLSKRFFRDRLGIMFSGTLQQQHLGSESILYDDSYVQQTNRVVITEMNERNYSRSQGLWGSHLKLDYEAPGGQRFAWYNAFIRMEDYGVRETKSTDFSLFYDPQNNKLDLSYQTRFRYNHQSIFVTHISGLHPLRKNLRLDWSVVWSAALNDEPDKSYFNLDQIINGDINNVYPDADGSTREWNRNHDRDLSGYLNLNHTVQLPFIGKTDLKYGILLRNRQRSNSQVEYRFKPDGLYIQGQNFDSLQDIGWILYNPRGSVGALEYDAHERIGGAYLMGKYTYRSTEFNAGVRTEYTDQGFFMHFPALGDEPDGGQQYADLLPSVHIRHKLRKNTNLRLSYVRSVNRPGFFEIVPFLIIHEDYLEFGNKDLTRAKIDNVDFRWEYFPKPTEQLMAGVFYKYLRNPIELAYTTVNRRQFGYGPMNLGNAQNIGFEVDFIRYLRNFGIKANYTFTYSSITTEKAYYGMDENQNFTLLFKDQTRPLAGQSPHTANLSLLYKSDRNGWSGQISASYTHSKIIIASRFLEADYWQAPVFLLDASFEKKFRRNISFFGKANNLLNTPIYQYIRNTTPLNETLPGQETLAGKTLIRKDLYERVAMIGFRWQWLQ